MATISFSAGLDFTISPKQWQFVDSSDYAGQGISLGYVNGCFTIYSGSSASGIPIYNNTDFSNVGCDIHNQTSRGNQTTIQCVLDLLTGILPVGNFFIVYKVYNSNTLEYYTTSMLITNNYVRAKVCIAQTADCVTPLFTSQDTTDYVVDGVTPSISRVHTISYPNGSSPTTSTSALITRGSGEFFNGNQTSTITSGVVYLFSNFTITDSITGFKNIQVDCTSLCKLYCCLRSLAQRMTNAPFGSTLYNELAAQFSVVMGLVQLAAQATSCGHGTDISGYVATIQAMTDCNDNCGCSDEPCAPVYGTGAIINNVIVESGDAYIVVNAITGGGTTTYQVLINPTLIGQINTNTTNITTLQAQVNVINSEIAALLLANEYTNITSGDNSVTIVRNMQAVGGALNSGSFGYAIGNTLTAVGGTGTPAVIQVDTVDGVGTILTWHFTNNGSYSVLPTNPVAFSGGVGVGASFSLIWNKYFDLSVPSIKKRNQTFSWAGVDADGGYNNFLLCLPTVNYPSKPNAQFIFAGTLKDADIAYAKVNSWAAGAANVWVKMRDMTNGNDICEVNVGTSTDNNQIIDFGSVANVPENPAVFGVFVKTINDSRGDDGKLASIILGYV